MVEREDLSIPERVQKEVFEQRTHYRFGRTELIPKKAQVVETDVDFSKILDLQEGDYVTIGGAGFLPFNALLPRRTIFLERPETVGGENYYLEIKGYGANGRELYPNKHDEGDLFYGMFFDFARREYDYPKILRDKGIENVQYPIALLKFDDLDFFSGALCGFEKLIKSRLLLWGPGPVDRVRNGVSKLFPEYEASIKELVKNRDEDFAKLLGKKTALAFFEVFSRSGREGLKQLVRKTGLEDELAGICDGREFGYAIRAVKSPFRVGDLHDEKIVTEKNKKIAKKIGETVRKMLELGFWHLTPNPGNWTTEGELVDFEDVISYPSQFSEAEDDMRRRKIKTLEKYVRFCFGRGTIGYLTGEFQEGFMGEKTSTKVVIGQTLEILEELKAKS